MLNTLKSRKKDEGFTIIEVLIVLAIAGLILLVVFLAVPALQRSQRNSARRQEAGQLSSAAQDFLTNSNGTTPSVPADADNIIKASGLTANSNLSVTTGAVQSGANVVTTAGTAATACTASSLTAGDLVICKGAAISFTAPASDAAVLATGAVCAGTGVTTTGAVSRNMALVYTVEQGSARTPACLNVQ